MQAEPHSSAGTSLAGPPHQERTRPRQSEIVEAALLTAPSCLVDIGVNLVDRSFRPDVAGVLQRAKRANVGCIVVTGTCVRTSKDAAALCDRHAGDYPLYFVAGVHPHNAKGCDSSTLDELRKLASHPRNVAIGECGLDFNRNFSPPAVQEEWFDKQVALAKELNKPLFMHCRDAGERFAEILRRHAPLPPAVVHCFTGSAAELQLFLSLGLHIGITGWICDERPERGGAELAALLPSIPPDRLMLETDAPYLTPRTIKPSRARPGRNEPALLPHVLSTAAQALGESEQTVAARTTANAQRFFGLTL